MSNQKKFKDEYRIWKAMRARCSAPSLSHLSYQQKGIQVCKRWNSFDNFIQDMGTRPSKQHSLDRIDNNGNYDPDNCCWATHKQQASNRGNFNLLYTKDGKTQTLKDWARELGIKYSTLYLRITRGGLSFEDAIQEDPYGFQVEFQGRKQTLKEWCEELGLKYQTIINRKYDGWTIEKALSTPTPNN